MSAHTPGPWVVGRTLADGTACIVGDGDSVVCTFDGRSHPEADAALIASAPDLLAALKDVVGWVPGSSAFFTDGSSAAVERARAAIAKAEGRA